MCGITAYIGEKKSLPILINGLKSLEYRGYDSAGVAIVEDEKIKSVKSVGKIKNLERKIGDKEFDGVVGIAHTRWATHGKPTLSNCHPHYDDKKQFYLVHNGIIENYSQLKEKLEKKGHKFYSDTDTEVVAQLISSNYKDDFREAVLESLKDIEGTYGFAIISKYDPDTLIVARNGSPILIGITNTGYIVASDASAIMKYTKKVVYLEDGEYAILKPDSMKIFNLKNKIKKARVNVLKWSQSEATKGGFEHYMLKEIFEAPSVIKNSIRGRILSKEGEVRLGGIESVKDKLFDTKKITIASCGTARYAGLIGEYYLEKYAHIDVDVEYASEFRYKDPIFHRHDTILAVSQSGETADTLEAIRLAKKKHALSLGIVNVVGSTIARETDAGVYNHIGPEIAVASTKAFMSQVIIFMLLTVFLGRKNGLSKTEASKILKSIEKLPDDIEKVLTQKNNIRNIAKKYKKYKNFLYLGRIYNYPVALEGALKLKEISYLHAEGYPTGEMKHGPIAMISKNFPSVFIAPKDKVYEKNISGIEEIKARGGPVLSITSEDSKTIKKISDDTIFVPKTHEALYPILTTIPLQLFAYYVATELGLNVDKPRNLAKSVTVE